MAHDRHGDDDEEQEKQKRFDEFECPDCDANNPWDEGFGNGDEVRCFYCGMAYEVVISDGGRLKFKEA